MSVGIIIASGRAKCERCQKLIAKGEADLVWKGYKEGGHNHLFCILKEDLLKKDSPRIKADDLESLKEKLMVSNL